LGRIDLDYIKLATASDDHHYLIAFLTGDAVSAGKLADLRRPAHQQPAMGTVHVEETLARRGQTSPAKGYGSPLRVFRPSGILVRPS